MHAHPQPRYVYTRIHLSSPTYTHIISFFSSNTHLIKYTNISPVHYAANEFFPHTIWQKTIFKYILLSLKKELL